MAKLCPQCGGFLSKSDDGKCYVCDDCGHRFKPKKPATQHKPVHKPAPKGFFKEDFGTGMTIGGWFITTLLLGIPFLGMLLMLYWAFIEDANVNPVRKVYARFCFILSVIAFIFGIIMLCAMGSIIGSLIG